MYIYAFCGIIIKNMHIYVPYKLFWGDIMLKNIGIYVNTDKDENMLCAASMEKLLGSNGFTVSTFCIAGLECDRQKLESFIKGSDAVFTLGGDGTLLMISKLCACFSVPVLGINLGRVGFLSEVEQSEMEKAITSLSKGEYGVKNRMMLECVINGQTFYALNEIVLHRDIREHMVHINVSAREDEVGNFYADGVLVASPTGSTAYNLSAGGPIVTPDDEVMLMTPISAHTLRARPYVFSAEQELNITASSGRNVTVAIDGAEIFTGDGAGFTVRRSVFNASFITFNNKNFYQRLNTKLDQWSTGQ